MPKHSKEYDLKRKLKKADHSSEDGYERRYRRKEYKRKRSEEDEEKERMSNKREARPSQGEDEEESTDHVSFTDESIKYSLNKSFFRNNNLVEDLDDFWLFVRKFEGLKKKSKQSRLPSSCNSKSPHVNINLSNNLKKLLESEMKKLFSSSKLEELIHIITLYLDFKQKEKFNKLLKLRQTQENLPVAQYRNEIVEAVKSERVVIIAGDTGCGKSTQVPQYLVKAGYNRVACTQPRRIACISLSKRVAFESLNEYTTDIGYQIRFEKNKNRTTKVVFITEGLLLRQLSGEDGAVLDYDVLVLDEVHERHLHGDFLLGIVKCLLHQDQLSSLRIILMSATININLFSDFFGDNTRVIQVPGRLHPITLHYRPILLKDQIRLTSKQGDTEAVAPYVQIMQLIDSKYPETERGDLLIFVSGISDIMALFDAAKQYNEKLQRWIILPLHSSLSVAEQDKVFDYPPEGIRKCIISTNIAETSITIDGIRFVIDSGKVKENSYDPTCKVQRLKKFQISRASAEQRKGRAGRTGPGVCYRLYSEEEYGQMQEYTTPEIQRVPLDSLLLQMVTMGLPDARKFPFIEPPPLESIETSILSLKQHGALTEDEKVTVLGKMLSKLPVDIPLGKMLVSGTMFHQVESILSLTAVLSVMTPFTNKANTDISCKTLIKELESDHGDPLTLLNVFKEWLEVKNSGRSEGGNRSSKQWCRKRGLEEQRFYEMTKLRAQFKTLLQDCGLLELMERDGFKALSSRERALRHGEVKLLKDMKRTYDQTPHRRAKILKADDKYELVPLDDEEEGGAANDGGAIDIRDIDFRLANDSRQVRNLVSNSSACNYRDLAVLKVILCSGLYPQCAIADEFNSCKGVNGQLYHTRDKPFVWLHPLSYFTKHPQALQLDAADIVDVGASKPSGKNPFSAKHQVLFYMSLWETTKTFLVNCVRMPAAQTLLLFAHQLHTNADFTKVVCDSWLQLEFATATVAETLMMKVVKLRSLWKQLLQLRLDDTDAEKSAPSGNVERTLADGIVVLMNSQITYRLKRLLPADLKTMYCSPPFGGDVNDEEDGQNVGSSDDQLPPFGPNPFVPDYKIESNPKYGGLDLTPYLVYSCLTEEDFTFETWTCENCEMVAALSSLERLQHIHGCQPKEGSAGGPSGEGVGDKAEDDCARRKPNSVLYECEVCNKKLYLTPIDILRHKKSH